MISLIGARLGSLYYEPDLHLMSMFISLLILIKTDGLSKLIGLLYIPRMIISMVSVLYASNNLNAYFIMSEVFLIIQLLIWFIILRNQDNGGNRSTNNNYICYNPNTSTRTILARSALFMDYAISKSQRMFK